MNAEVKQRKAYVHTKRVKPTENDTPEEVRVVFGLGYLLFSHETLSSYLKLTLTLCSLIMLL